MSLAELICQLPDNQGGAIAGNRLDYQINWALCHILELHRESADYVVVLDFHDDVVVIDSATVPQTIVCYQIKTKRSGNWSRQNLIQPLPSILGKLYRHYEKYSNAVHGLCFVSNAPLRLRNRSGGYTVGANQVSYDDLRDDEQAALATAIRNERNLQVNPDGLVHFRYYRSPLTEDAHSELALGKVASFIAQWPETQTIPAMAFYRTLKGEIQRAMHAEVQPTSLVELCRFKAVTRERFQQMLSEAAAERSAPDHAAIIRAQLMSEQVPFRSVNRVAQAAQRFVVKRLNPTDVLLIDATTKLEVVIARAPEHHDLWSSIEAIRTSPQCAAIIQSLHYNADEARGMIGVLLHEQEIVPDVGSTIEEGGA